MSTHFNDAIARFLEYQKNSKGLSENAMSIYSINILNFFSNIYSPTGFYHKVLKPKLSQSWGNNNESPELNFYGFLLSFSHGIAKNLTLDKRNFKKNTIIKRINESVF